MVMKENPVWTQRENESAKLYGYFKAYLEEGPTRSFSDCEKKTGRSLYYIKQLSARYDWVARSRAWDIHNIRIEQAAAEAKLKKQAATYAAEVQKRRWDLGMKALSKAEELLDSELSIGKLSDAVPLLAEGNKLVSLAAGIASDKIETTQGNDRPVRVIVRMADDNDPDLIEEEKPYAQLQPGRDDE